MIYLTAETKHNVYIRSIQEIEKDFKKLLKSVKKSDSVLYLELKEKYRDKWKAI